MAETVSWIATIATIIAASLTAANLGTRTTGLGFVVFTLGALCWIALGWLTNQPALMWTNIVLTLLDIFGIWRWLGRQAKVEEGARNASEGSEHRPGEALFPVSLLSRARMIGGGSELGHCIDAMAGSSSGSVSYVVVSAGGVAGVGETFRRVPWASTSMDGEVLVAKMTVAEFELLPELARDQWPAR